MLSNRTIIDKELYDNVSKKHSSAKGWSWPISSKIKGIGNRLLVETVPWNIREKFYLQDFHWQI